jgi:uncharacterized membrane protein YgcG
MLILLAMSDHHWRIATGRGFESLFPDERVATIGAEMVPDLKQKRYSEALLHATSEIADTIAKERGVTLTTIQKISATKLANQQVCFAEVKLLQNRRLLVTERLRV